MKAESPEATTKQALLAYMDIHGKATMGGVLHSFPHIKKAVIKAALDELVVEGWIKIKDSFVHDGFTVMKQCVYRTRKQVYTQAKLFGHDHE